MRGASALARSLPPEAPATQAQPPVSVVVAWMPVIPTDVGRPMARVRRLLPDPRVVQLWDPERRISDAVLEAARRDPAYLSGGELLDPLPDVAWDVVAVFPPGARWEGPAPPRPAWFGAPVVHHEAELARRLGATPRGADPGSAQE